MELKEGAVVFSELLCLSNVPEKKPLVDITEVI